jgi:hypothetical protein
MAFKNLAPDEVVRRGKELYDRDLRSQLEPHENGKYVVVDIESGAFEVDRELIKALKRLEAKINEPQTYIGRIGYPTAIKIGGAVTAAAT